MDIEIKKEEIPTKIMSSILTFEKGDREYIEEYTKYMLDEFHCFIKEELKIKSYNELIGRIPSDEVVFRFQFGTKDTFRKEE